jgi:hypothetical protein
LEPREGSGRRGSPYGCPRTIGGVT